MSTVTESPAVLFPGQGSQAPGMRDLVARECPQLLERCLELVGEDPFARVDESTRFAQPAIFCASVAGWSALDIEPHAAAGHSLGELGALAAAGVLAVEDALELVVLRGRLMAEADDTGTMLALLGASDEDAAAVAGECGVIVANDNAPGQLVLSGAKEQLDAAAKAARARGLRSMPLGVSGAFHSPSMRPAVEPFREALENTEIGQPRFPVLSCASAAPFEDVREELTQALVRPVRWRQTMLALREAGAPSFVDVGPGKVLARLAKRIAPGVPIQVPSEEARSAIQERPEAEQPSQDAGQDAPRRNVTHA